MSSGVKTVAEIAVIADTKQAREEMKKLAEATGKTYAEVEKQVKGLQTLGNKWSELSKSMVGLQMHDTFKRVSDGAKEATNGVLDLNSAFAGYQVAGPWGAAIGLVGVAAAKSANYLDALGVSIDELEKKAQKQAIDTMPGWAKEIWATRDAVAAMNLRLYDTPGAVAAVFTQFSKLYPLLKKAREEIQAYDSAPARLNRGLRAGGKGLQDFIGDITTRGLGVSSWGGLKFQSGGRGGASYDGAATDLGSQIAGNIGSYDYLQAMQDRADAASRLGTSNMIRSSADLGGYAGLQSQVDAFNSGEFGRRNAEAYGDFATGQQQSFLEKTFGPVDQFDLYAQGFQMLSGAVGSSLSAWIDGSASAGEAFKKFIGEALKGIAVQMAMESLKHGAYALGSLAFGDFRGAATHGKAALMFGTGAVLAAGAAKAFNGGGASVPSTGSAPNVSGGSGGAAQPERIIVFGDPFAEDSPRGRQRQAKRMVSRALGNSSVENN